MSLDPSTREIPDPEDVLRILKDFQRDTVEYVFRRLYLDDTTTRRFLVADEVGLGKTMVARGVIAKTLDLLDRQGEIDRLDVIYVCSNAAIAQQNVRRLNVTGAAQASFTTRLGMLSIHVRDLDRNRVNFVSLTPDTSFRSASRGGRKEERILLWTILGERMPELPADGLLNLLQCGVQRGNWLKLTSRFDQHIDDDLAERFVTEVARDPELRGDLARACTAFREYRDYKAISDPDSQLRYDTIGRMRALMARVCVHALEPDLIILDEFQRFSDLLRGDDDAALLTKEFLDYQDPSGLHARTLLLSATPYRMMSLHHEEGDHYRDFIETCRFLFDGDDAQVEALRADLGDYRRGLMETAQGIDAEERIVEARRRIERRLRSVMVRTERVPETRDRGAMLTSHERTAPLAPADLEQMKVADGVARVLGSQDVVEYWKSAPYLVNLMKDYKIKRQLIDAVESGDPAIHDVLANHDGALLREQPFERYDEVLAANPRLRQLIEETVEPGLWRLLWMPPSCPYVEAGGAYAEVGPALTKRLIFSTWTVVPDAIAALCSYAAERRMVERAENRPEYSRLNISVTQPLRFQVSDGRYQGQYNLLLLYPSPALATAGDLMAQARPDETLPLDPDVVHSRTSDRIRAALSGAIPGWTEIEARSGGVPDQTWYWQAAARLDAGTQAAQWAGNLTGWRTAIRKAESDDGAQSGFDGHVLNFVGAFDDEWTAHAGAPPEDTLDILTLLALGGPANCALRALHRVVPELPLDNYQLLESSAQIANGFRTLFDLPESYLMLRSEDDRRYWEAVLRYCIHGNLQAVLDEYVHVLVESLGLVDADPTEKLKELSREIVDVLSIRTSPLAVDELRPSSSSTNVAVDRFRIRTRFALRFGDLRGEEKTVMARAGTVRAAFNSPFRPFVLASTSVGQEGLDFHLYCHAVHHWNLPSNPVDLEQREGRVHRYKSHAVRKNIAEVYGSRVTQLAGGAKQPWPRMFEQAVADRPEDANDLVPFWIYEEGKARVERHIPILPLSREVARVRHLVQSLATYRMAFGQPRQEDLIELLGGGGEVDGERSGRWEISLCPPRRETV